MQKYSKKCLKIFEIRIFQANFRRQIQRLYKHKLVNHKMKMKLEPFKQLGFSATLLELLELVTIDYSIKS